MPLKIYNSLTKQKEELKPIKSGEVKMYVCGPTVYDEPHIGHLRSAYCFEVMRRYLEYSGYKVTFIRNVTDVDDKIIEKAKESKPSDLLAEVSAVSEKYHVLYKKDLEALGIQAPTVEPRATGHIPDMQWLITKLLEKGSAYAAGGDVYFDVNAFQGYGKLSHQQKEAMMQNVRIEKNEKKKSPLDFALWKSVKEGEPYWDSPWGKGRPGWHIECSAMSMKYLGETFDIHGGGRDLIFPHHENEIAQSECVTGSRFANTWIHHGLITINEQKMSKSLKNFISLNTIKEKYSESGIEELKFLFLGTHYSAPLDYSPKKMEMEKSVRERFVNYWMTQAEGSASGAGADETAEAFELKFKAAMDDDFNTPQAISVLHELVDAGWKADSKTKKEALRTKLSVLSGILGLSFQDAKIDGGAEVKALMADYDRAKQTKDFPLKDAVRSKMLGQYQLKAQDNKDGSTNWVKAS